MVGSNYSVVTVVTGRHIYNSKTYVVEYILFDADFPSYLSRWFQPSLFVKRVTCSVCGIFDVFSLNTAF